MNLVLYWLSQHQTPCSIRRKEMLSFCSCEQQTQDCFPLAGTLTIPAIFPVSDNGP